MKVKLYNAIGGSFEIDDTPQRRAWAKGKGYVFEKPPKVATPSPKPPPPNDGG